MLREFSHFQGDLGAPMVRPHPSGCFELAAHASIRDSWCGHFRVPFIGCRMSVYVEKFIELTNETFDWYYKYEDAPDAAENFQINLDM